jgi:hypothetical protein
LRRWPVRQVQDHFVNITPAPAFGRVIGFDDWVTGCMKMLRRVPIGRLITATDVTAGSADAQVQPWVAELQAFFTAKGIGNNVVNSCQVPATLCHVILLQYLLTVFCLISIPTPERAVLALPNMSDIPRRSTPRRVPGRPFNAISVSEMAR